MNKAREVAGLHRPHKGFFGKDCKLVGNLVPAGLHSEVFAVVTPAQNSLMTETALWIKSKLLSLAFEDKVLILSSQLPLLTSATI